LETLENLDNFRDSFIDNNNKADASEKAFWLKTLELSEERLDMDRRFMGVLEKKKSEGRDPLDPLLWENFIEARKDLVDYTTSNLNVLSRDKTAFSRNKDVKDRLETTLDEVMRLEEKLAAFLSRNLLVLKDTIEELNKNQAIFTAYSRHNHKSVPEAFETRA
jgi:hypothetical protein